MPEIKKTSDFGDGKQKHYHIVYLNDVGPNGPMGAVSTGPNGHVHDVYFDPGNPELGEVSRGWMLGPAEDGHGHEIVEYVRQKESIDKGKSEAEIADEVVRLFRTWREAEDESIKDGRLAEDFYEGKQWGEEEKSYLEERSRAVLTINRIEKNMDELSGHQRQNRTDIRYMPVEGGDQRVSDMLNILAKVILENNYYHREETKVFEDIAIAGRGVYNLWVDFSKNIEGELRVEKFPWDDVTFAPHEKEDLEDCEGLIKHKMFSKASLERLWKKKAKKIDAAYVDYLTDPNTKHVTYASEQYARSDNTVQHVWDVPMIDIARKEFRVLECWRKYYDEVFLAANAEDDFYLNLYGWKRSDIDAIATIPGLQVVSRMLTRMRVTKICANVVLSDEYPADLPVDDFFCFPVYAKRRRGKFWGKVRGAIDAQKEINHRHSQAVDIGNKMAAYGWFIDSETFPDDQEKHKFISNSTSPGFVAQVSDLSRTPVRVEGVKFPSEVVQLLQLADQSVAEQLNIQVSSGGANESGEHLMQRQRQRLVGNEYLFDAMTFAKKKLGVLLLHMIQKYYTPQRIFRIVSNQASRNEVQVGGRPLNSFSEDEIVHLLTTTDLAQHDVEVAESTYSPTQRLGNFILFSSLAEKGLPIPPEILIEWADMPQAEKDKAITAIQQAAQMQSEAAQQTRKQEIQKTLIAQGVIPPEVQQELQLQQTMPQQAAEVNTQNTQGALAG